MTGAPYKVVEVSNVTDQEIERCLNEWVTQGYRFDSIHFVMKEGSRRPSMAFVFFTKEVLHAEERDEV
ncbi:MAG: DUF4177 domain-containing protein [Deltaproteobacteria bacterium]|nr:MAG: DUF4177 domain-containing protein [Deltaproteobacteria bacterium]